MIFAGQNYTLFFISQNFLMQISAHFCASGFLFVAFALVGQWFLRRHYRGFGFNWLTLRPVYNASRLRVAEKLMLNENLFIAM